MFHIHNWVLRFLKLHSDYFMFTLGGVHKLRLQEEVGRYLVQKCLVFVNVYKVENVNAGGRWSKKTKNLST